MLVDSQYLEIHNSYAQAQPHEIVQTTNQYPQRTSVDPKVDPNLTAQFLQKRDVVNTFNMDNTTGIQIDRFIQKLESIKSHVSSQRCARSIRIALESAGAVIGSHPIAASDWGDTLMKLGYKHIQPEFDRPQEGDIYIIHRTSKHVYGHIAGFTGSEWVSDFKQKSYDVYKDDGVQYEYYRLAL
jgi:hypothetical protein